MAVDNGVPDLGGPRGVPVVKWVILPANAVDFQPGALVTRLATTHLRVIDIPHSKGYVIPLTPAQMNHLLDQLRDLINTPPASAGTSAPGSGAGRKDS